MYYRVAEPTGLSSRWTIRSTDVTLRHIESQVVALISQHSSLMIHKRAIERQLTSIVAQIHEPDVELTPNAIFLLLEMRGSGGVSEQLEQIAHIVHEQGYWKPNGRIQNYRPQDVYHLGKSTQRLFDDYSGVDRRVEQLYTRLGHIKQHWQMEVETTIPGIFECLATAMDVDIAEVQSEVNPLVKLLAQASRPIWLRRKK